MAKPEGTLYIKKMDARYMNSMMELSRRLPPEVIYAATIQAIAHGTTGKYASTNTPTVTAVEILTRYGNDNLFMKDTIHDKEGQNDKFTTHNSSRTEKEI